MTPCRFCLAPRRRGSVMCGADFCRRAYYRAWHRANRRAHPERYGDAFYRARGTQRPDRRRPPPAPLRVPRLAERLSSIVAAAEARWFGLPKAQLLEDFAEFYPRYAKHTATERRFFRDLRAACASGRLVWTRGVLIRADRVHALAE